MHEFNLSEKERNLYAMFAPSMVVVIDEGKVNIDDLLEAWRPGAIIRCDGPPDDCIKIIHKDLEGIGCVAGWISDEDDNA